MRSLILFCFALLSCQKESPHAEAVRSVPGEIQLLNACGLPKVATMVREHLMRQGFDVVEIGNSPSFNFDQTIIALRNPHWTGRDALAKALRTNNVIPLENSLKMVDATIYIGKDITKVLENE